MSGLEFGVAWRELSQILSIESPAIYVAILRVEISAFRVGRVAADCLFVLKNGSFE